MLAIKQDSVRRERQVGAGAMEGLTPAGVAASRRTNGENRLTRQKSRGFWSYFVGNLKDPVIRILLAALLLNLALTFRGGDWIETVGIGVSVVLATLISTLSECRSERAFLAIIQQ